MKTIKKIILRFSVITFIVFCSFQQYVFANETVDKIKPLVDSYIKNHFLNAVYAFSDESDNSIKGAHGLFSVEDGTLLVANQQMPIASVTKSMTAACILKLKDKKAIDLSENIAKYLPANSGLWDNKKLPEWANKVTIHNLLTHSSGIPEYFMSMELNVDQPHNEVNKQILNFVAQHNLIFDPGSEYKYNNTNYVLLGLIIEQVSGKSLSDFYNEELFIPLNMSNTRLLSLKEAVNGQRDQSVSGMPIRYFVTPQGQNLPQFTKAQNDFIMVPYADGGVVSTTNDIIKWHQGLHAGKIISKESLELMKSKFYELPNKVGQKTFVGYGLFISELENSDLVYHHSGNALAIRCESGYIPSKNLYFAVLSNVMNYIPEEMKDKIDMDNPKNQLDIYYFIKTIFKNI